ncbi:MAG: rod shape-determining protein MreC [Campylobacterota bacterium]|nr:rod shape-determining protein MreC [Campylobacterota bacterium]
MNKKFLIFVAILLISFSYIFNVDRFLRNQFSALNNSIISIYLNSLVAVQVTVNKYFNQLDYIEQLKTQNDENQKYKLLYNTTNQKLKELKEFSSNDFNQTEYNITKVKVLSYYKFNDHTKVLISEKLNNSKSINSLITYDGYSAGIVLEKENKTISYLNENEKCNYTVYIGENNAPGITAGINKNGLLVVKFIPLWKQIKIDDEIITSGMDNIFPIGIKVAKVVAIKENDNTKELLAIPYAKTSKNRYFYMGSKITNN